MNTVTSRVRTIKQPWGGYIRPKAFKTIQLDASCDLYPTENLHPTIIGIVVDYLTRFNLSGSFEHAFDTSIAGVRIAGKYFEKVQDSENMIQRFKENIVGLDNNSVFNACKLASFDVWYRDISAVQYATPCCDIFPDNNTIANIQEMVNRSSQFWRTYGPITKYGFSFEPNGYTDTVILGDGDYLTKDTLWDFKVSKNEITSKHTLQILMYWIMGKHSGNAIFDSINNIGIFNPRLNKVYTLDMTTVPVETIQAVENDVICYKLK